jgi:hypothetical protein
MFFGENSGESAVPNRTFQAQLVTNKSQRLKVPQKYTNAFPIKNKVTNKK